VYCLTPLSDAISIEVYEEANHLSPLPQSRQTRVSEGIRRETTKQGGEDGNSWSTIILQDLTVAQLLVSRNQNVHCKIHETAFYIPTINI
jgi:hypothetical protein